MYQKQRLERILDILKHNGYVTVKYLVSVLDYSNATINRDLNLLEKQKHVKRTYGGVEYVKKGGVPLAFRYHKMKGAKIKIAKKAAEFICDGDVIFIDGSTTAEYVSNFIIDKNNITVITNNMAVVSRLCEYKINVVCLGGQIVEAPTMLGGEATVEMVEKFRADKMFFSVGALSEDGCVGSSGGYYLMHKAMMRNANEIYLLADSDKFYEKGKLKRLLCSVGDVDYVISDKTFSEEVIKNNPTTKFIKV